MSQRGATVSLLRSFFLKSQFLCSEIVQEQCGGRLWGFGRLQGVMGAAWRWGEEL